MRLYTVHYRAFGLNPKNNLVLIREGFSWAGFFFSGFWALAHGLWIIAAALFIGYGIITGSLILFDVGQALQIAVNLGYSVLIGFLANDLHRWSLERQDFDLVNIVSGASMDDATRRFLDFNPEKTAAVYS